MKKKTSELTGAALDWAVAKIVFPEPDYEDADRLVYVHGDDEFHFTPSTNWAQGGPIIEREQMDIKHYPEHWVAHLWANRNWKQTIPSAPEHWKAKPLNSAYGSGPTMLIAAMRCYVASKLGENVEPPEGLQ